MHHEIFHSFGSSLVLFLFVLVLFLFVLVVVNMFSDAHGKVLRIMFPYAEKSKELLKNNCQAAAYIAHSLSLSRLQDDYVFDLLTVKYRCS